jgi:poly(ADP-ribose) glycohydrolase ARH3
MEEKNAPPDLRSKFSGSLLGGMLGDIIGAAVEGESPRYIQKTFGCIDDILAVEYVEEVLGGKWMVGRFTDDTQMSLCVAEWLIEDPEMDGKSLFARFSEAYRPARRYGSGTARILEAFPDHHQHWTALATLMFPGGSYGNGSAMRAGPIGSRYFQDPPSLIEAARISSMTTHSHTLAVQGAILQAWAVAAATRMKAPLHVDSFLQALELLHTRLQTMGQDTSVYAAALHKISCGIRSGADPAEMVGELGTGITAQESVPMALYCFLASPESFERVIESAVFLGGDTDTIACMAGALSGAFLGLEAIPRRWIGVVREEDYTPGRVVKIGEALCDRALCAQR